MELDPFFDSRLPNPRITSADRPPPVSSSSSSSSNCHSGQILQSPGGKRNRLRDNRHAVPRSGANHKTSDYSDRSSINTDWSSRGERSPRSLQSKKSMSKSIDADSRLERHHRHNRSVSRKNYDEVSFSSETISVNTHFNPLPSDSRTEWRERSDDALNLHRVLAALLATDDNDKLGHRAGIVVFPTKCKEYERMNYSFSTNTAVRLVDMESQRLLKNLLSNRDTTLGCVDSDRLSEACPVGKPRRLTPASLNRSRQNQRIERENLELLNRLSRVKSSMNREEQLNSYNKQMASCCPELRSTRPQLHKTQRPRDGCYPNPERTGRPSSAISRHSNQPISAKSLKSSRPRRTFFSVKPAWEERWYL